MGLFYVSLLAAIVFVLLIGAAGNARRSSRPLELEDPLPGQPEQVFTERRTQSLPFVGKDRRAVVTEQVDRAGDPPTDTAVDRPPDRRVG